MGYKCCASEKMSTNVQCLRGRADIWEMMAARETDFVTIWVMMWWDWIFLKRGLVGRRPMIR